MELNQVQWITLLTKVFLVSGATSIATWIAVYSRLAPWWRTAIGRALVFKTALVGALMSYAALPMFVTMSPSFAMKYEWAGVVLIGLVTPAMAYRTWVWLRLHKAGSLRRDNGKPSLT